MNDRLISIIVPVYKVEKYLNRCIKSIVEQTYSNLEIILVDDGSPDKSPEICDEWAKKDNRIKVIHRENGGLSAARNDGIRIVSGEYYLLVDSDDYLELDACERLNNYADGVDVVIGEATIVKNNASKARAHTNLKEDYIYTGEEYSCEAISKGEWFAAACYNFYNTKFVRDNELYFCEGVLHEDVEYTPRLFLAAKKVKYLHYQFYNYIIRGDSITGNIGEKHFTDLIKIYSRWYKLNCTITNSQTKKYYCGALAKYYMATCREHKIEKRIFPEGMDCKYLISHALNIKEFIKAVIFTFSQKIYIHL